MYAVVNASKHRLCHVLSPKQTEVQHSVHERVLASGKYKNLLQQPQDPWVHHPQQHRHSQNAVGQAPNCEQWEVCVCLKLEEVLAHWTSI